jgi:hypothetical protein
MTPPDARATVALKGLRPGEPSLGTLPVEEQNWLVAAVIHLIRIDENRDAGQPGNAAFCIFDFGNAYVQFLAPFDGKHFLCEAASAKTVPELAATLTSEKEKLLYDIGFEAVGISPNYSQTVEIESIEDIGYAARLAFRVLKQIYGVTSYGSGEFELNIPSNASN